MLVGNSVEAVLTFAISRALNSLVEALAVLFLAVRFLTVAAFEVFKNCLSCRSEAMALFQLGLEGGGVFEKCFSLGFFEVEFVLSVVAAVAAVAFIGALFSVLEAVAVEFETLALFAVADDFLLRREGRNDESVGIDGRSLRKRRGIAASILLEGQEHVLFRKGDEFFILIFLQKHFSVQEVVNFFVFSDGKRVERSDFDHFFREFAAH